MNISALQMPKLGFFAQSSEVTLIDGADTFSTDPNDFVNRFLTIGLALGVVLAIVLVVVAGYKMINSKGDSKAIADAQEQMSNAIMGFLLIVAAATVVKLILDAVGINNVVTIN